MTPNPYPNPYPHPNPNPNPDNNPSQEPPAILAENDVRALLYHSRDGPAEQALTLPLSLPLTLPLTLGAARQRGGRAHSDGRGTVQGAPPSTKSVSE